MTTTFTDAQHAKFHAGWIAEAAAWFGAPVLGTSDLRARGWTPAMIRNLLGEPDSAWPNPYCSYGAPARLYAAARVEAVEQTSEFAAAQAKAAARSAVARRRKGGDA